MRDGWLVRLVRRAGGLLCLRRHWRPGDDPGLCYRCGNPVGPAIDRRVKHCTRCGILISPQQQDAWRNRPPPSAA